MYTSWREGGPKGTVYKCSKSGWFDMFLFEEWFVELLLPRLRKRPGKKLIIGDNLASHISPTVIKLCKANNIAFVCLPPNSTDKLQPLDVGVFAPMKKAWRVVLTQFKKDHPKLVGIPKPMFPGLLKALMETAKPAQHLAAAFDRCGLYPFNPKRGMDRIPSRDMEQNLEGDRALLNVTFGKKLEELRGLGPQEKQKRGKKVKTAPGKSYTVPDTDSEEESEADLLPGRGKGKDSSEESEEDVDALLEGGGEGPSRRVESSRRVLKGRMVDSSEESGDDGDAEDMWDDLVQPTKYTLLHPVGSYVAAIYDREWYVAQVEAEEPENETDGYSLLKYMERKGNNQFVWGSGKDTLKTVNTDILRRVDPPIPVSSRLWGLPKDVVKDIEKRMRVKWSIIEQFMDLMFFFFLSRDQYCSTNCRGYRTYFVNFLLLSC